jgi:hypothetical protein
MNKPRNVFLAHLVAAVEFPTAICKCDHGWSRCYLHPERVPLNFDWHDLGELCEGLRKQSWWYAFLDANTAAISLGPDAFATALHDWLQRHKEVWPSNFKPR